MLDLAERASAIAQSARTRVETTYIAREWWRVTLSGGQVVEVPGAGIVPA